VLECRCAAGPSRGRPIMLGRTRPGVALVGSMAGQRARRLGVVCPHGMQLPKLDALGSGGLPIGPHLRMVQEVVGVGTPVVQQLHRPPAASQTVAHPGDSGGSRSDGLMHVPSSPTWVPRRLCFISLPMCRLGQRPLWRSTPSALAMGLLRH
jgi:hypothetical protein